MSGQQMVVLVVLVVLCAGTVVRAWSVSGGLAWYECCCKPTECNPSCYTCRNREVVCDCGSCGCAEDITDRAQGSSKYITIINTTHQVRGLVKLKNKKNPKKTFLCVFFVGFFCTCLEKNWIGGWVGGVWPIYFFIGFWDFQLDKTP